MIERDGKDYPSNAFAILTGNGGLHVATQCGVFKGTTKAVFVDRREYSGPLWEQIDEAFQFVLRNIHLGATLWEFIARMFMRFHRMPFVS